MLKHENDQKISSWIENFTTRLILSKFFRLASFWNKKCTNWQLLNLRKKSVSFWYEFFTRRQILNKTFRPASFWNKNSTKCQILNSKKNASAFELNFHIASDFEIKVVQKHRFSKKNTFEKSRFASFRSVKTTVFAYFSCFLKGIILNSKLYNVSDFELTENTTCQYLFKNFTTFRTSNQKFSPGHSFFLVEELLQKLQPLCSTYQHVNCPHTQSNYRVGRNFVAKSGEVFDNVQRGVYFN